MAPGADPAFEQAMDKLMTQVSPDNVLDVHAAFRKHADELLGYLQFLDGAISIGHCGTDPVSIMAAADTSFGGKVKMLTAAHWDHGYELRAVADRLRETARNYGHTEEQIDRALRTMDAHQ